MNITAALLIAAVSHTPLCTAASAGSASPESVMPTSSHDGQRVQILSGQVTDKASGEPIPFATIYLPDLARGVAADINGNFSIQVGRNAKVRLKVSSLGYQAAELTVATSGRKNISVMLEQQSVALKDFTVTAKYNDKTGSDATIGQEALEYIQPTSIQDIFQLLPGGKTGQNNMQSRSLISSRQVGSDESTAFGMGLSIDGVPVQNDGQRIQMTGITAGTGGGDQEGNTSVNTGVDMRTISTDHIESVTVNRGIASAKEGNLSSGTIRVTPKQGSSPMRVRIKFDPLNKLAYVGKGIRLSESLGTLYAGADIVRSATSIEDTRGAYNRVTGQLNWNNQMRWWGKAVDMSVRGGYITSFNNNRTDDLTETLGEKYNTRYQNASLSAKFNMRTEMKLVDDLELIASANYTSDVLRYDKLVQNRTVTPLQHATEEGEHEGTYLPSKYRTYYSVDNQPFTLFTQFTANKYGNVTPFLNFAAMLGTSLNYTKNFGQGAVVDQERPPYPSSDFIRPRANSDIPAIVNHATYAELKLRCKLGRSEVNSQWGVRETMMLNLPHNYALHGKALFEPRLQMSYTYNFAPKGCATVRNVSLRAGFGIENKLPSADFLYPDKVYHDFTALNAYSDAPEKRLLITNTKIQDPTNPALRENRNSKFEVGVDFNYDGYAFSVTGFYEKMKGGVEYFTQYTPASYTYYYKLKNPVDGRPAKDDFYSRERHTFMQLNVPTNSAAVTKRGVEYRMHVPTIIPLHTEVEINGAYYSTEYSSGVPVMYWPQIMENDEPYPYVGVYNGYDKTRAENFNTNFWINTHLPKLKLIFTNFIQIVWFEKSRLCTDVNEYPSRYMDTDGKVAILTPEQISANSTFETLRRKFNSARYNELRRPVSLLLNLKLTKEFGRHARLSFFADNLLQVSPKYKNNYLQTIRDWQRPFFGAELTLSLL